MPQSEGDLICPSGYFAAPAAPGFDLRTKRSSSQQSDWRPSIFVVQDFRKSNWRSL
jgi:hypothetical protein